MSLIDEAMAIHRHSWSSRISQAQAKLKASQGKAVDANRMLDDERRAREAIVQLCELIEAKRRLDEQIPKAYGVAMRWLNEELRVLLEDKQVA